MAGDPVACSIIGGILAFVVFVAVVGFFVICVETVAMFQFPRLARKEFSDAPQALSTCKERADYKPKPEFTSNDWPVMLSALEDAR